MRLRAQLALMLPLSAAAAAAAVDWEFGIRGGVPVTAMARSNSQPFAAPAGLEFLPGGFNGIRAHTRRYSAGPTARIGLARNLSLRGELLYSRLSRDISFHSLSVSGTSFASFTAERYSRWQIPVLLEFTPRGTRGFFLGGGGAASAVTGGSSRTIYLSRGFFDRGWSYGRSPATPVPERRAIAGFAAECGWRVHRGRLRVVPSVRYIGWGGGHFESDWRPHLVEVLLGLTLGSPK